MPYPHEKEKDGCVYTGIKWSALIILGSIALVIVLKILLVIAIFALAFIAQ